MLVCVLSSVRIVDQASEECVHVRFFSCRERRHTLKSSSKLTVLDDYLLRDSPFCAFDLCPHRVGA